MKKLIYLTTIISALIFFDTPSTLILIHAELGGGGRALACGASSSQELNSINAEIIVVK